MWQVYDVNTGETMHTFRNELEARLCAIDLNKSRLASLETPHGGLHWLYRVRKAS
jgi:hypothetical protein